MSSMRPAIGLTLTAVLLAVPARAFNPQPEPPAFGMVGLARTQTALLSVVLQPVPEDGRPPCLIDLSFVDASGRPFRDAAGHEVRQRVELRGNVAAALTLRWQDAIPDGQLRATIRAMAVPVPDDGTQSDCSGLVATLEIVDVLGAARVLYAPTPDDGSPTPDDGRAPLAPAFGIVGLGRTQTASLNVVLVPTPDDGQPPCLLDLSFVDASGRPFHDLAGNEVHKRVELRDNVAAALPLRWQDAIPNGQPRAPIRAVAIPVPDDGAPDACAGLAATLEIVDLIGATRMLYAPIPDDGIPTPDDGLR